MSLYHPKRRKTMKTKPAIEAELTRIKTDERLGYPAADVFVNAPLALIQVNLASTVKAYQWVLEGVSAVDRILQDDLEVTIRKVKGGVFAECHQYGEEMRHIHGKGKTVDEALADALAQIGE
jgi:hypothetical protein